MTIEDRIESLEVELRRARNLIHGVLTVLFLGAGVAVAGFARLSGEEENEVHATRFVLQDDQGNRLAELAKLGSGPALRIFDDKGHPRAMLNVDAEGPSLTMADENGNVRTILGAAKEGPSLSMMDNEQEVRAILDVFKGGPELTLADPKHKTRVGLFGGVDGPALVIIDDKGITRCTVGTTKTTSPDGTKTTHPESTLILFKPDGHVHWMSP